MNGDGSGLEKSSELIEMIKKLKEKLEQALLRHDGAVYLIKNG